MDEPRSRVVGDEADGDIVANKTSRDNIASDWVHIIVWRTAGATDDGECMLQESSSQKAILEVQKAPYTVKMNRMLQIDEEGN